MIFTVSILCPAKELGSGGGAIKKKGWLVALIITGALIFSEEIVTTSSGEKVILYDDHTWVEIESDTILGVKSGANAYQASLRKGTKANEEEISAACEMLAPGGHAPL